MTDRLPELDERPIGIVLDAEVVAFNVYGVPRWPLIVERVLHRDASIAVRLAVFDERIVSLRSACVGVRLDVFWARPQVQPAERTSAAA